MGNIVTTAEVAAAEIVPVKPFGSTSSELPKRPHPPMSGEPPPECPMHQKKIPAPVSASECPINAGQDVINPLNMVSCFTFPSDLFTDQLVQLN